MVKFLNSEALDGFLLDSEFLKFSAVRWGILSREIPEAAFGGGPAARTTSCPLLVYTLGEMCAGKPDFCTEFVNSWLIPRQVGREVLPECGNKTVCLLPDSGQCADGHGRAVTGELLNLERGNPCTQRPPHCLPRVFPLMESVGDTDLGFQ